MYDIYRYNTALQIYTKNVWYFSLNFFLQRFLVAVTLHRFINKTSAGFR
jgi:hypothetical protein